MGRRRIAQLMRAAGLRARAVRGYRAKVKIHHLYARHPNRLWDLSVTRVNQVWVGDITFLKVDGGWQYLAIVMDQYSRRILGWTLTRRRTSSVVCQALNKAAAHRPTHGVIFHSDRGSEYICAPFGDRLVALDLQQSANVSGPGDNAHAESFFHTLKAEPHPRRALPHRPPPRGTPPRLHAVLRHDAFTLGPQLRVPHCL